MDNFKRLKENKGIVREFVERVQNGHDINAIDKLFASSFIDHYASPGIQPNREGAKQFFTMFFNAFPDVHVTIHDQIAEGNQVVTRKTFRGTHKGEFMGMLPTGKQVTFGVIDIMRISEDKIVEHWAEGNLLGLMQQLGVVPSPKDTNG